MKRKVSVTKCISFTLLVLFLFPNLCQSEWYKGNTHTHTINSDGDSTPDAVVRWYKENHYNFLVITDHNFITEVQGLNSIYAANDRFIVIPGCEISCSSQNKPVHIVAINISEPVMNKNEDTIVSTLQKNIDIINSTGALAQVCHPNFRWAFGVKELALVDHYHLLEIKNSHPLVNNEGGGGYPSTEKIWDSLLTEGKMVFGVACDDTHTLRASGPQQANPGRGWVCVRCDSLCTQEIVSAMARGEFYSSTGVELNDITYDGKSLVIHIKQGNPDSKYMVEFIGSEGKVLDTKSGIETAYQIKGSEKYIRARITDSNGLKAWSQPVFLSDK